jgi:hypothetical protein
MDLGSIAHLWDRVKRTVSHEEAGGKRRRARGRTNRLRRFGPNTMLIRQRLMDLESIRQAALARGPAGGSA